MAFGNVANLVLVVMNIAALALGGGAWVSSYFAKQEYVDIVECYSRGQDVLAGGMLKAASLKIAKVDQKASLQLLLHEKRRLEAEKVGLEKTLVELDGLSTSPGDTRKLKIQRVAAQTRLKDVAQEIGDVQSKIQDARKKVDLLDAQYTDVTDRTEALSARLRTDGALISSGKCENIAL